MSISQSFPFPFNNFHSRLRFRMTTCLFSLSRNSGRKMGITNYHSRCRALIVLMQNAKRNKEKELYQNRGPIKHFVKFVYWYTHTVTRDTICRIWLAFKSDSLVHYTTCQLLFAIEHGKHIDKNSKQRSSSQSKRQFRLGYTQTRDINRLLITKRILYIAALR